MEESRELYEAKSELLKALAHPLRLQIVRGLLVGGCHNVRCMEAGTGQSQSTISQHLMRLKAAGVSSVSYSVNTERTNVIMGTRIMNLYGPGYITDTIGDIEYRISPLSFYQVNPVQTEKLYGTALEFADLSGGETVWDLYCGIGTISSFLAKRAGKVYGVCPQKFRQTDP